MGGRGEERDDEPAIGPTQVEPAQPLRPTTDVDTSRWSGGARAILWSTLGLELGVVGIFTYVAISESPLTYLVDLLAGRGWGPDHLPSLLALGAVGAASLCAWLLVRRLRVRRGPHIEAGAFLIGVLFPWVGILGAAFVLGRFAFAIH